MKKSQKKEKNQTSISDILRPNLYDLLKVFAICVMIIDHIGYYLFPDLLELRLIGRFAFPIFLFLVGFNGSYRWRRSLLGMAILVQIVMWILGFATGYGSAHIGNILFTILLTRGLLHRLQKISFNFWGSLVFPLLVCLVFITPYGQEMQIIFSRFLDYGLWGFLFAFCGFFARRKDFSYLTGCTMLALLMGVFAFQTIDHFHFNELWMQQVIFLGFLLLTLTFYLLIRAKHKERNLTLRTNTFLDQIFLFISRNALWIYGGHILVLIGLFFLIR